jgi:tRNA/rRNA methyltransferase
MAANLENLFRRVAMTDADVRTLHGVIRALAEKVPGRQAGSDRLAAGGRAPE